MKNNYVKKSVKKGTQTRVRFRDNLFLYSSDFW